MTRIACRSGRRTAGRASTLPSTWRYQVARAAQGATSLHSDGHHLRGHLTVQLWPPSWLDCSATARAPSPPGRPSLRGGATGRSPKGRRMQLKTRERRRIAISLSALVTIPIPLPYP